TFVVQRLEEHGLTPSPEADKSTLIRRLYLDLVGLLPPPEDVTEFLLDHRSTAYNELVERLLKSPHYGERWGRHWLDQARYADSNGYTIDGERFMWPYRDWVIKALNLDMPFDQFTIEQLAGDLLPHPTREQILATGFHRNTLINQEGGTDPEQFRIETVMDRVSTTGAVWMGLTVACAQCHTHKFDPISQREYYQMLAFFNHGADVNNVGPTIDVHPGELFADSVDLDRLTELQRASNDVDQLESQRIERQRAWEATQLAHTLPRQAPETLAWTTLKISQAKGESATFKTLPDDSVIATPGVPREIYVIETVPLPAGTTVASIQLRVMPDESLPQHGPGLASNGNFVLTALEAYLGDERLSLVSASASRAPVTHPAIALIDDNPGTAWKSEVDTSSTDDSQREYTAWVSPANPVTTNGRPLKFLLKHELNNDYNIGRLQLSISSVPVDAGSDVGFMSALRTPTDKRTKEQEQILTAAFASVDTVWKEAKARVERFRTELQLGPAVKSMVMQELPSRRATYLLTRGDFLQPDREGGTIEPDVFQILPKMDPVQSPDRPTRLDLARWLVRADNPLTPRVTVNRMWMHYFGRGLVETENDFGSQGSPPTHPELLDWLASQFIAESWSQKAIHRLIVTSATYRQSSYHRAELEAIDPLNLLLARQNRVRLDAEIVRDVALVASGKFNPTIGGPSVQPPQPEGVYSFTQNRKEWRVATGDDRYRRAMYTKFYRSAPYPTLTTFDSPDFQSVCTRRARSNTPLQALTLSNDEAMYEFAQGFADRILANIPEASDKDRTDDGIRLAYLVAYARPPNRPELNTARDFLQQQQWNAAATELTATQKAAWTALARALINTDEFITRE
ncbi:MAG: DUF1549 and DUF1553 domain-containing protein, partial [Planctomycetota bacterium]|nr:DUF1549 and DUF1553 domain-containing protein [Planctomycetota bacterium]